MKTKLIVDNKIRLTELPEHLKPILEKKLNFPNPKYMENEQQNRWNGETPRMLEFLKYDGGKYTIPRGFIYQLWKISNQFEIEDKTRKLPEIDFAFNGKLHSFQKKAIDAILKRRFGVLNSPTGSGKTVTALYAIAERKQPTLVIIHTKELLFQWQERAEKFLGLSGEQIGLIGDGRKEIGTHLTIGIVNSIHKIKEEIKDKFGFVIVDECHRTPSRTFTEVISNFDSYYMLGLSATPFRRDGLTKLIYFFCGDEVFRINPQDLQQQNKIMTASLNVRETDFYYNFNDNYVQMLTALTENHSRNVQIADDVFNNLNGGISLVLSDRKSHCQTLFNLLDQKVETRLLTGDLSMKKRKETLEELEKGKVKVLVATSQLIGEGFDLSSLSTLFLATPIKFSGKVIQSVGRILRTENGKKEAVVFDYVDKNIPVLKASFYSRKKAYRDLGIEVEN